MTDQLTITIVYDNTTAREDLLPDWGFACLVAFAGRTILFDTGANGRLLLANLARLGFDPAAIDEIFISHAHFDHTGGLASLAAIRDYPLWLPGSLTAPAWPGPVQALHHAQAIHPDLFSTGELMGVEQSLVVRLGADVAVIAGCSHPGVGLILDSAARFGRPTALIGGLHGFRDLHRLEGLQLVCPAHCTQYQAEIQAAFPSKYVEAGAGRVIALSGP